MARIQGSVAEQILSQFWGIVAREWETVGLAEVLQHEIIIEDGERPFFKLNAMTVPDRLSMSVINGMLAQLGST